MVMCVAAMAACNGDSATDSKDSGDVVVPPVVDDTDDTDVVLETGWGTTDTSDTDVLVDTDDTDVDTDDTDDTVGPTQPPSDTGRDTAECPFGEVSDCDGICYPSYFIGDGTCDDGSAFQSNFDCVEYAFDGGDCDDDTGNVTIDTDADGCLWVVHIDAAAWANELGWQLLDASDNVLYEVFAGTYANGRDYYHTVLLPDGDYQFVKIDSFGDGWNASSYEVYDEYTGEVIASGSLPAGSYDRDPFTVACEERPETDVPDDTEVYTCGDLAATMVTQGWGGEISWHIREQDDTVPIVTSPAYMSNETAVTTFALESGWYELVQEDAFGDGWAGATLTIDDIGLGTEVLSSTLANGPADVVPFFIDCSDTFNPIVPISDSPTCNENRLVLHTTAFGADFGWELFEQTTGQLIAAAAPGSYQSNRTYEIPVNLSSGTFDLHLIDAFGDGWGGGYIEVLDVDTGIVIAVDGLAFNDANDYWFTFDLVCPNDDDTDVEPLPEGSCAPGAVPDCSGVCWPTSYQGDGFCDDGTVYAANFYCAQLLWDGGDCGAPPSP
jgi:hypothetical protein